MEDYRVNIEIYNGPLDLLLYLIRRDEVDIYDIPIARITEQYVQYVEVLKALDPNLAGEFLVMAATLMEVKTRMLLPVEEAVESEEGAAGDMDPRAELVRQLLEYKAFKDAAGDLADAAEQQALKYPRKPALPELEDQDDLDIGDVQIWDLVDAFSRIMAAIGQQASHHEVIYDDTPIELHAEDLVDRLRREGKMRFSQVFQGRTNRSELVGLFLAMLELVRTRRVVALQEGNFGEIYIELIRADGAPAEGATLSESETAEPTDAPVGGEAAAAEQAPQPADDSRPQPPGEQTT